MIHGVPEIVAYFITALAGGIFGVGILRRKISNINGTITPSIFDKKVKTETLDNDNEGNYEYYTQENIVFKGNVTVSQGEFEFSFKVPKDISYVYDRGKISYFTKIGNNFGNGLSNQIIIGGTNL